MAKDKHHLVSIFGLGKPNAFVIFTLKKISNQKDKTSLQDQVNLLHGVFQDDLIKYGVGITVLWVTPTPAGNLTQLFLKSST